MRNQKRPFNFSAGPGVLPESVLEAIQAECLDWYQGLSVMELSHRSKPVLKMRDELESLLRQLLNVPDSHEVLFMHGGARGQFSAVPLNLLGDKPSATYLLTGIWGKLAAESAGLYGPMHHVELDTSHVIPGARFEVASDSAYTHYTDNETIDGIEFPTIPEVSRGLLVSDMTSSILSKPLDWAKLDCVYASAQKNLGIAGVTYVFVKKALMEMAQPMTPDIIHYKKTANFQSMLNTPPVFAWYVTHKMLNWVQQEGGLKEMEARAKERSEKLYACIDQSALYENTVPAFCRSRLNVPFSIKKEEALFMEEARNHGLYFLEGHRLVGGARASLYNAMPVEGVDALVAFMQAFEKRVYA